MGAAERQICVVKIAPPIVQGDYRTISATHYGHPDMLVLCDPHQVPSRPMMCRTINNEQQDAVCSHGYHK
jgi:hypothetical protein